jgi:hypothetical protein
MLYMLEVLEDVLCVLELLDDVLCMLETVEDGVCLLEVLEVLVVPEVMLCVLLWMLQACGGWALFAGGSGGGAPCGALYAGSCGRCAMHVY